MNRRMVDEERENPMLSDIVGVFAGGELVEDTSSIELSPKTLKYGTMPTEEFKGILNAAEVAQPVKVMEEIEKAREIAIRQVANGYIVSVGCETFVFTNTRLMMDRMSAYFKDPNEVEREFREGSLFAFQSSK